MKILWLTPYPISLLKEELGIRKDVTGHPSSWIVNLSDELKKNNDIELHILTLAAAINSDREFLKSNIHFHVLKHNFPLTQKGYPNFFPLDAMLRYVQVKRKIIEHIQSIAPDIIHIHGTEGAYPSIVGNTKEPVIISIQGIINKIYKIDPSLKGFFQKNIESNGIKHCKYFGCRTEWDKSFVISLNPEANIYYLPEAINYSFFEHRWKQQTDNKNLLFIGSLNKRKGIYTLLEAVKHLKQKGVSVSLKIIGENINSADKYFLKLFNKLAIEDNVFFLGKRNSSEIALMLAESAIYVHPSFIDNSPNSLAEAMAVGTPCIASNVGGIPNMIEDCKTGLLFKAGNENDLAIKIELLLNDEVTQNRFSHNSKQVALRRNYPPVVADNTINCYKKILEG